MPLSHVYLTFSRSLNSPHNPPSLRLWIAGTAKGKKRRWLLAGTTTSHHEQLAAQQLTLTPTSYSPHINLEFELTVLHGIHFYQSDVDYSEVNADNMYEVWAPRSEAPATADHSPRIESADKQSKSESEEPTHVSSSPKAHRPNPVSETAPLLEERATAEQDATSATFL